MELKFTYYPSPILKKKCKVVTDIDEGLRIGEEIKKCLREEGGVGLAANQVGLDLMIAVIAFQDDKDEYSILKTIINPKIIFKSPKTLIGEEGCLSFPSIFADVERPYEIVVEGYLEGAGQITFRERDWQARIFCHEIDHLNGIPFIDRMSPVIREMCQPQLDQLAKKYQT